MLDLHEAQGEKLEARNQASESRWMQEVDRGRQALKVAAQQWDRADKEYRRRIEGLDKSGTTLTRALR